MKRTMPRKNTDKPQPNCVMIVRVLRSELEIVSLRGVCKIKQHKKKTLFYFTILLCDLRLVISLFYQLCQKRRKVIFSKGGIDKTVKVQFGSRFFTND